MPTAAPPVAAPHSPVASNAASLLDMSLNGSPSMSNPQLRPRSCSIFCSARIAVDVEYRAPWLVRVEMANSDASATRATTSSPTATITSTSEKPDSLLQLDFANAIHLDLTQRRCLLCARTVLA